MDLWVEVSVEANEATKACTTRSAHRLLLLKRLASNLVLSINWKAVFWDLDMLIEHYFDAELFCMGRNKLVELGVEHALLKAIHDQLAQKHVQMIEAQVWFDEGCMVGRVHLGCDMFNGFGTCVN